MNSLVTYPYTLNDDTQIIQSDNQLMLLVPQIVGKATAGSVSANPIKFAFVTASPTGGFNVRVIDHINNIARRSKYPIKAEFIGIQLEVLGFDRNGANWHILQEQEPDCHVYFMQAVDGGLIKIGSSISPKKRLCEVQNLSPVKLRILTIVRGDLKREKELHKQFSAHRSHGEWFHPSEELLDFIKKEQTSQMTHKKQSDQNMSAKKTGNDEWYTPEEYIVAARKVMGGIDLDPASSDLANKTVQVERYYTIDNSALDKEWSGRVWMNPPFSMPLIEQFIAKAIAEYRAGHIEQAVIVTNNATDTGWFHNLLKEAGVACLSRGRVRFSSPKNDGVSPRQGQSFFYLGNRVAQFVKEFARYGTIVVTGATNHE